jgi:hypothetical protein
VDNWIREIWLKSAGREGELARLGVLVGGVRVAGVGAAGAAGLGAGTERLVDDRLDGARAAAAFGATAEAAVNLLGISSHGPAGIHGIADIVVAENVTGADNHQSKRVQRVMLGNMDIVGPDLMQKEKTVFVAIPN